MSDPAAPDRPPYPLEMVAGTFGDEQEAHGLKGRVVRALQAASSGDLDHVRHHAQHLLGGGYVIAYYANHYIESLGDR